MLYRAGPIGNFRGRAAPKPRRGRGGDMIRRVLSSCVLIIVCLSGPAFGQAVSGTILGTVTDITGAVRANAKVTVLNEGTGLTRTMTADGRGEYVFPSL